MKTFKNIFIIIFPVLFMVVIIQHATSNHIGLYETWKYTENIFDVSANDFLDEIETNINVFRNMNFNLPSQEEINENDLLSNIWNYIKWFGNVLYQAAISIFVVLSCIFESILLALRVVIIPIRVILFISGLSIGG